MDFERAKERTIHCYVKAVKSMENGGFAGPVLTEPSKSFDCLSHEIINCKAERIRFEQICIEAHPQLSRGQETIREGP